MEILICIIAFVGVGIFYWYTTQVEDYIQWLEAIITDVEEKHPDFEFAEPFENSVSRRRSFMSIEKNEVLNEDDPTREGNLTAEQYRATYDEPGLEPHGVPADVVAEISKRLDQ